MIPACGPPRSLSPLKQHTSTPAAIVAPTVGSDTVSDLVSDTVPDPVSDTVSDPVSDAVPDPVSDTLPDPRSSATGMLNFLPIATSSARWGRSVNPSIVKLDGWTRRISAVFSVIAAA
jgi:hypothetical protein